MVFGSPDLVVWRLRRSAASCWCCGTGGMGSRTLREFAEAKKDPSRVRKHTQHPELEEATKYHLPYAEESIYDNKNTHIAEVGLKGELDPSNAKDLECMAQLVDDAALTELPIHAAPNGTQKLLAVIYICKYICRSVTYVNTYVCTYVRVYH